MAIQSLFFPLCCKHKHIHIGTTKKNDAGMSHPEYGPISANLGAGVKK
jgi:hypothetical protein